MPGIRFCFKNYVNLGLRSNLFQTVVVSWFVSKARHSLMWKKYKTGLQHLVRLNISISQVKYKN